MKLLVVLLSFIAAATAQFGGFGGFGNAASALQGGLQQGAGAFQQGVGALQQGAGALQQGLQGIASSIPSPPLLSNVQDFGDFLAQSGKTYLSAAERTLREGTFAASKNLVDAQNAAFATGASTFKLAINAFSDLTQTEFLKQLTGLKKSAAGQQSANENRVAANLAAKEPLPDSFDWREKGGVTPVKFQGECGSCWSFAAVGAIEGHVFRKTGHLPNLSEQNLVDCGPVPLGLAGCDGGFQEFAFNFIVKQKGIADGSKYPYVDNQTTCQYNEHLSAAKLTGFASIPPKDEEGMKTVIATQGPLACSINALKSLLLYETGIYSDEECNKDGPNHSILVVGYGSENGVDYWIVKNSWDKNWGEEGFFRLKRGSNFCDIAIECSYPVL